MVAQAPLARLASPVFNPVEEMARPLMRRAQFLPTLSVRTVKLLDLVTNRYHVGVLRSTDGEVMTLDLARPGAFQVGQRIRFIVAESNALVSRQAMQSARVTAAVATGSGVRLELAALGEAAAA